MATSATPAQLDRIERTLTDNKLYTGDYDRLWKICRYARLYAETGGQDGSPFPTASATISWLGAQGYYPANQAQRGQHRPYPKIPAGYYATTRTSGSGLDFWQVEVPETGKWAGRSFAKRVTGGRPGEKVYGDEARAALEAIQAQGTETCRERYARELEACWKCNIHLTDDLSRQLLIGPDCCKRVYGMTQAQRAAALAATACQA